jgi:hypothetical protein
MSLIVFTISSLSPPSVVFVSSRSGDTILLGVGNCLISFIGSSAKLFNLGVVV